jgi:cytochrome c5
MRESPSMETSGMRRARQVYGILSAGLITLSTAAAQQIELPAGPNRELVSHECQECHDLGMVVAAAGQSREGWNSTIDEMIGYGMHVTPGDRAKILDYLSRFLARPL